MAQKTKISKEDIISSIKSMSVLELSELVKALEEEFGVSAVAPVTVAPTSAGTEVPVEEKTEFDVILSNVGEKKIEVIKAVRNITGLSLKEAKTIVDEAPKAVREKITKDEAEKVKKQLEAAGATAEIK